MFALNQLAKAYETEIEIAPVAESPSSKVLKMAAELPASAPELEREALRVEALLEQIEEAESEEGTEMLDQLAEIFENQVEAIYGLLNAEEQEDIDWSRELLVKSHSMMSDLEERLESAQDTQPLFA
jgi:hypothetical protein